MSSNRESHDSALPKSDRGVLLNTRTDARKETPRVALKFPSTGGVNQSSASHHHDRTHLLNLVKVKPRLELVHIPKTGGTALEIAAARANVTWSICHHKNQFNTRYLPNPTAELPTCPPKTNFYESGSMTGFPACNRYHLPPCFFINAGRKSYYDDAALFAVVRNPYDRIVSEYGYRTRHKPKSRSVKGLNEMMGNLLESYKDVEPDRKGHACQFSMPRKMAYCKNSGHLIPQYDFVYGDRQRSLESFDRVVHHVLRYENLHDEFAALMKVYGGQYQNVTLVPHKSKNSKEQSLSTASLSLENRKLIEQIYQEDFEAFGYKTMDR